MSDYDCHVVSTLSRSLSLSLFLSWTTIDSGEKTRPLFVPRKTRRLFAVTPSVFRTKVLPEVLLLLAFDTFVSGSSSKLDPVYSVHHAFRLLLIFIFVNRNTVSPMSHCWSRQNPVILLNRPFDKTCSSFTCSIYAHPSPTASNRIWIKKLFSMAPIFYGKVRRICHLRNRYRALNGFRPLSLTLGSSHRCGQCWFTIARVMRGYLTLAPYSPDWSLSVSN